MTTTDTDGASRAKVLLSQPHRDSSPVRGTAHLGISDSGRNPVGMVFEMIKQCVIPLVVKRALGEVAEMP